MQLRHFLYFPSIVLVSAAAQIRIVFPFEIQSCFTHVAGEYAVIAFQPACQQEQGVVKCIIVTASRSVLPTLRRKSVSPEKITRSFSIT